MQIHVNLQINKMMIKMNKQRYFDVSFWYSKVSWGNKTDPIDRYLSWFDQVKHKPDLKQIKISFL